MFVFFFLFELIYGKCYIINVSWLVEGILYNFGVVYESICNLYGIFSKYIFCLCWKVVFVDGRRV